MTTAEMREIARRASIFTVRALRDALYAAADIIDILRVAPPVDDRIARAQADGCRVVLALRDSEYLKLEGTRVGFMVLALPDDFVRTQVGNRYRKSTTVGNHTVEIDSRRATLRIDGTEVGLCDLLNRLDITLRDVAHEVHWRAD
jgi:hypothetical protein